MASQGKPKPSGRSPKLSPTVCAIKKCTNLARSFGTISLRSSRARGNEPFKAFMPSMIAPTSCFSARFVGSASPRTKAALRVIVMLDFSALASTATKSSDAGVERMSDIAGRFALINISIFPAGRLTALSSAKGSMRPHHCIAASHKR